MLPHVKAVDHLLPTASVIQAFEHRRPSKSLDETIERRVAFLTDYQNAAYGARYRAKMYEIMALEKKITGNVSSLSEVTAKNLFHLMAIKDEYEVARLYSSPSFKAQLSENFSQYQNVKIHLAPPLIAKLDPNTGEPRKIAFGSWILNLFLFLSTLKFLRSTPFDLFGKTAERKRERQWLADYEALLDEVKGNLTLANLDRAIALLSIPQEIRGFGHVREKAMKMAAMRLAQLKSEFYEATAVEN